METKRIIWIDALNIVACAGALLLHCTNEQVHNFQELPLSIGILGKLP